MGDRVRWLHYVIRGEPQSWTVEPVPAFAADASAEAELRDRVEALIAVSHPWGSAAEAGGSLSYGRLPDGAGLLYSARTVRGSSAHRGGAAELLARVSRDRERDRLSASSLSAGEGG